MRIHYYFFEYGWHVLKIVREEFNIIKLTCKIVQRYFIVGKKPYRQGIHIQTNVCDFSQDSKLSKGK